MQILPNVLSVLRLMMAPMVFLSIQRGRFNSAILLVVLAVITDLMDGLIARRQACTSRLGSYLDVMADFSFLFLATLALVFRQVYSPWLLAIMLVMFLQFVLRPKAGQLLYDPVGKYYGALLYGVILLTLIAPDLALAQALYLTVLVVTASSFCSRVFLTQPAFDH